MSTLRRLLIIFISLSLITGAGVFCVGVALIDRYKEHLPDHLTLKTYMPNTGSLVLASDGTTISTRQDQKRIYIPSAQIPKHVIQAFISAEDQNFYTHDGVDLFAIIRAGLSQVSKSSNTSGGSTIAQQVAKNLLVGSEKSIERKIKEAILAIRMTKDVGRERILDIYLNEIFLGQGSYGVASAAETYFGKSVNELTWNEAAVLAALPKAPSSINPIKNMKRATERRNYVLKRLYEDGKLTSDQAQAFMNEPIQIAEKKSNGKDMSQESQEAWFEEMAWKQLKLVLGEDIKQDTLLHTTLHPEIQMAANLSLKEGILRADRALGYRGPFARTSLPVDWTSNQLDNPLGANDFTVAVVTTSSASCIIQFSNSQVQALSYAGFKWTGRSRCDQFLRQGDVILVDLKDDTPVLAQSPITDGALVAMNPQNGNVLAYVGGYSRERSQFDRVSMTKRQAGSSFKPVIYASALKAGYDPASPLLDAPIVLEQGKGKEDWIPNDAKGAGKGTLITFRRSLELSRNLSTVRLLWDLGIPDVQDMALSMGLISNKTSLTNAAALGAIDVSPLQMATAYSAFANRGVIHQPRFIQAISDKLGGSKQNVAPSKGVEVIDEIAAAQMASVLQGVIRNGTAREAFSGFNIPFAGKTGTTNQVRDAWFVGFSKEIVIAIWIGRDDNGELDDNSTGGKVAAPIMRDFLQNIKSIINITPIDQPQNTIAMKIDPETGLPSNAQNAVTEYLRVDNPLISVQPANGLAKPVKRATIRRKALPAPPAMDIIPDDSSPLVIRQ